MQFEVLATSGAARRGRLTLAHGVLWFSLDYLPTKL